MVVRLALEILTERQELLDKVTKAGMAVALVMKAVLAGAVLALRVLMHQVGKMVPMVERGLRRLSRVRLLLTLAVGAVDQIMRQVVTAEVASAVLAVDQQTAL